MTASRLRVIVLAFMNGIMQAHKSKIDMKKHPRNVTSAIVAMAAAFTGAAHAGLIVQFMDPVPLEVRGEGAMIEHTMLMDFGVMPMTEYFMVRRSDESVSAPGDPALGIFRNVPAFTPFLRNTIDELERYRAAFPEDLYALTVLAVRLYQARQAGECLEVLTFLRERYPLDARSGELYSGVLVLGRDPGATQQVADDIRRTLDALPENHVVRFNLACAYALAGDADRSLEQLQVLVRAKWDQLTYNLGDADLEALFADPRFKALQDEALRDNRQRISQQLTSMSFVPRL